MWLSDNIFCTVFFVRNRNIANVRLFVKVRFDCTDKNALTMAWVRGMYPYRVVQSCSDWDIIVKMSQMSNFRPLEAIVTASTEFHLVGLKTDQLEKVTRMLRPNSAVEVLYKTR